jgi:hypothetical protein
MDEPHEEGFSVISGKVVAAVSCTLFLVACTTTTPAERRLADEAQCRSYGFRPGTDGFSRCLLALDLNRAANRRAQLDYLYGVGRPGWYW